MKSVKSTPEAPSAADFLKVAILCPILSFGLGFGGGMGYFCWKWFYFNFICRY